MPWQASLLQIAPQLQLSVTGMQGTGLNSIRNRFTIMVVMFVAAVTSLLVYLDGHVDIGSQPLAMAIGIALLMSVVPGLVTYVMAGKLTGLIGELRRGTEAIAGGDFDTAVNVNCACEIGGLADSFRTMVARLNSNILRMNVMAYTDRVTQLPNRAVITHILNRSLSPGSAPPFSGTIMFIDLDKFKQVNDSLGHDAGDELLHQASDRILRQGFNRTAKTIDSCMTAFGELCDRPPSDIVFVRLAGDEFVALIPGVMDRGAAEGFARRTIDCLREPFRISNTDVTIGASIGIACTPQDTSDPAELLNYADLAMYAAKQSGRGRYAFFDSTMREAALQRVNIERELREAIPRGEIITHFQPKIDSRDLSIAGVEALARWNHPARGILSPKDFIAVAEQSGLIEKLGGCIMMQAMQQCAEWQRSGRPLSISLNVSQLQFARPDFVDKVVAALEKTGAQPELIELELTESTALADPGRTTAILSRLHEAGVRIAIDDFGCGFSNLSQLARLPFDTLKVGRSLVECIGNDPRGESVIRAIVSMGHSLGHSIVAEGVETLKQLSFLRLQQCNIIQGFLFARPMSAEGLAAWEASRGMTPAAERLSEVEQRWAKA